MSKKENYFSDNFIEQIRPPFIDETVDVEDEEPEDPEGYYKVLKTTKDAKPQEIKEQYRKLSQKHHPDRTRHLPEKMRKHLESEQVKINEAYEILSEEEKRMRYDILGKQGQLVLHGYRFKDREEMERKLKEERLRRRKIDREMRTGATSKIQVKVDVSNLFEERDEEIIEEEGYVQIYELVASNSYQAPITDNQTVTISSFAQNMFDRGSTQTVGAHYRNILSTHSFVECSGIYQNGSLICFAGGERQLTKNVSGGIHWMLLTFPALQVIGFDTFIRRRLSDTLVGQLRFAFPYDQHVTASLEKSVGKATIAGEIKASTPVSHLKAEINTPVTEKETISFSGNMKFNSNLNSLDFEVEGYGTRKLTENSELGMGVGIGSDGITLKFLYKRDRHVFAVPILLSTEFDFKMMIAATFIPSVIYGILRAVVIEPLQKRWRDNEIRKRRLENWERTKEEREEAQRELEKMQNTINESIDEEEEIGGLIIINARYGVLDEDVETEHPPYIDVTKQLQYYVHNSKLELSDFTKSKLEGFYDPAPGEEKQLEVYYRFKGKKHKVTIKDDEELIIPQEEDIIE